MMFIASQKAKNLHSNLSSSLLTFTFCPPHDLSGSASVTFTFARKPHLLSTSCITTPHEKNINHAHSD